jgi:hypothetical protein
MATLSVTVPVASMVSEPAPVLPMRSSLPVWSRWSLTVVPVFMETVAASASGRGAMRVKRVRRVRRVTALNEVRAFCL